MKNVRVLMTVVLAAAIAAMTFVALVGVPALAQDATGPGPIVFSSNRTGNFEIFMLNPDTGLSTQLTNDPGSDLDPVWSPDGSAIAFISDRDGDFEIFVMRADGTDVRQLTNNQVDDVQPRWQPNGLNITFVSDINGQWDVYMVSADGAIVRQLTNDPADERLPGADTEAVGPAAGGQPPAVPTATTGSALPDATVDTYRLNVRSNPGEGARILTSVPQNTPLEVVGRYSDNTWLQVRTPSNVVGWVYAPLVRLNIDLAGVPVIAATFIAPPPTATYTPEATAAPQVIIEFWADRTEITIGECVNLHWRVQGIKAVYFNGEGVVGEGTRQVCPTSDTTYNLRVVRVDDVVDNRYITIVAKPLS